MRKIINRKVYDTDTAEFLGGWDNGYYGNDFHYCYEGLYRTKKGTYFVYGKGGAMSKYAKNEGNGWSGPGEDIHVLTKEDAMLWAERCLDAEDYESIFGNVEEG